MIFLTVLWLYGICICDLLEFPSVKSFCIFTVHSLQRDKNFKYKKSRILHGSFPILANLCLLPLQKNMSYRFF